MTDGGQVDIYGTLVNAGNTLSLDTSDGSFVLGPGGTIQGGTIAAATPDSAITATNGGTLDGVTLDINLNETTYAGGL